MKKKNILKLKGCNESSTKREVYDSKLILKNKKYLKLIT